MTIANTGIQMPKFKNRFHVSFESHGEILQGSQDLSMQVTKVSKIVQNMANNFGITFCNGTVIITFEDDAACKAGTVVQRMIDTSFDVVITTLNGNGENLDRMTLQNCSILSLDHGTFDYAGASGYSRDVKIKAPRLPDTEDFPVNSPEWILLTLLRNTIITSSDTHQHATVSKKLEISYERCIYSIVEK